MTDLSPDDRPADPPPHREGIPRVVEQAAEVLVFAPIGFVVQAPRLVPELARRGRQEVDAVRRLGGDALGHGHRWLTGRLRDVTGETRDALRGLGHHRPSGRDGGRGPAPDPTDAETASVAPSPSPTPDPGRVATTAVTTDADTAADTAAAAHAADAAARLDAPDITSLAIPDYDNLSASQVVPRLAALDPPEREAVRRYEQAGRSRKTILNRIAQLQGG